MISFTSDWRFSPARSREIVKALVAAKREVSYLEIKSEHGHDTFLMPIPRYMEMFKAYLARVAREVNGRGVFKEYPQRVAQAEVRGNAA